MLSLGRATVRVRNLEAARDVYTRGFGFSVLFDQWLSPDFRALHVGTGRMGDPGIWLLPHPEGTPEPPAAPAGEPALVLYSDDLDADLAHLAQAVQIHPLAPVDGEPGARFATVSDPWGNLVVIAERP